MRLDVEPNMIFRFAARGGITSDAIALVEEGRVDVSVIEERARESSVAGRPLWIALAARAACVRGDRLGVVRLLRSALAEVGADVLALDLSFVWTHADPELTAMLSAAAIPFVD
jgi:hypothetical protein